MLSSLIGTICATISFFIRLALDQRPTHLEAWRLYAELIGSLGNHTEMNRIVKEAEIIFDNMNISGISKKTRATIYHQLATSFLSVITS